ncbi:MAG: outer membrane beta-barrel protein [Candidatus Azobacteroides sp.]|nr:outer membrane beta-barrel protein [Candidatus Azobacteroides sp.]
MNVKSFLLSGLLALLSVTFVFGQSDVTKKSNVTIGVRGGLTMPGFTGGSGNPLSEGYSSITRCGAGIFADFKINNLFSIQPMLEYTQEGAKKNGFQAFQSDQLTSGLSSQIGQGLVQAGLPQEIAPMIGQAVNQAFANTSILYANFNSRAHLDYLMLPVLAKFGWDLGQQKHWRIYVDAGPYISLLLKANQVVSNGENNTLGTIYTGNSISSPSVGDILQGTFQALAQDPQLGQILGQNPELAQLIQGIPNQPSSLNTSQDIKSSIHPVNWGVEGNVGIQYQISARNRVFIEGGGNYGLMNIQKYAEDGKNHNGAATLMIGYGYTL